MLISNIIMLYGIFKFLISGLPATWCYVSIVSARYSMILKIGLSSILASFLLDRKQ